MVVKNLEKLAKTKLRKDALSIIEAGYESICIESLFKNKLKRSGETLEIDNSRFDLAKYQNIYVLGAGKGSAQVAREVEKIVGSDQIKKGFVIDIAKIKLKKIKVFKGTHPLPSEKNIKATNKIISLLKDVEETDLVISIICGGGSALFCKPSNLTCLELQAIFSTLLKSGATIQEMNTVRKHLSLIHGGYLAKHAYPATLLTLIISDVPGDDISMVASGPTVLDQTTKIQAETIAKKYGLTDLEMIETPKDSRYFKKTTNILIASGSHVVKAMAQKATQIGYQPTIASLKLSGLAKEVGPKLAEHVKPNQALLACGETEVVVTKPGKGGRNQDVVLSAIPKLTADSVIISAASDGKDNVNVAGAIGDGNWSKKLLLKKKLDPLKAVENNQSYKLLHKLRDHLFINKVTANISDFILVLRGNGNEN